MAAPVGTDVRVDSHCFAGYRVPPHYDSLLGKLICRGDTRDEALDLAARALDAFDVAGVDTTLPLHRELVRHPDVRGHRITTRWVEESFLPSGPPTELAPRERKGPPPHDARRVRRPDAARRAAEPVGHADPCRYGRRRRRGHRPHGVPDRRRDRKLDVRVHDALLARGPVGGSRPLAHMAAERAAARRKPQQLHREVRADAGLADGPVDPDTDAPRHPVVLDLRLSVQHGPDAAVVPDGPRRGRRGRPGDHVRDQPGAHRRVVRGPRPGDGVMGHRLGDLRRGRSGHPRAGTGRDADSGARRRRR
ncbi:hypothetical protein ACFQV8_29730 [Pseudonocardia benzenivorans]